MIHTAFELRRDLTRVAPESDRRDLTRVALESGQRDLTRVAPGA